MGNGARADSGSDANGYVDTNRRNGRNAVHPNACHICRAEGALSIVAPENIVENTSVLNDEFLDSLQRAR